LRPQSSACGRRSDAGEDAAPYIANAELRRRIVSGMPMFEEEWDRLLKGRDQPVRGKDRFRTSESLSESKVIAPRSLS